MNTNIKEDYQICISVPLGISRLYVKQVETTLYFFRFFHVHRTFSILMEIFPCLWKCFCIYGTFFVFLEVFLCLWNFFSCLGTVHWVCRRGGGGLWDFVGAMKYFRHILMGHEIFFKIFDGPQNIFLCSIFIIFIF